jgi:hypothetical protein
MVELGPEAVATIDAHHAVEVGWLAQLERQRNLDRTTTRPALEMMQATFLTECRQVTKEGVTEMPSSNERTGGPAA